MATWAPAQVGLQQRQFDSVYRIRLSNLSTTGTRSVTIEWDTTKAGKHALDYIDDFDESVNTPSANPCVGVANCDPAVFGSVSIPVDPQLTSANPSVTPKPGLIRVYGGSQCHRHPAGEGRAARRARTRTAPAATATPPARASRATKPAAITINFQATRSNPVIAWGGHIATRQDWGRRSSAVAHLRLPVPHAPHRPRRRWRQPGPLAVGGCRGLPRVHHRDQGRGCRTDATDFAFTASRLPRSRHFTLDDDGNANAQQHAGVPSLRITPPRRHTRSPETEPDRLGPDLAAAAWSRSPNGGSTRHRAARQASRSSFARARTGPVPSPTAGSTPSHSADKDCHRATTTRTSPDPLTVGDVNPLHHHRQPTAATWR